MNENLKKALKIAKQGQAAMQGYEPLVSITIGWHSAQLHIHNEEFLANFPDYRQEEGTSSMHLHADCDGVDVVTLIPYKEFYKKEKPTHEPEAI